MNQSLTYEIGELLTDVGRYMSRRARGRDTNVPSMDDIPERIRGVLRMIDATTVDTDYTAAMLNRYTREYLIHILAVMDAGDGPVM